MKFVSPLSEVELHTLMNAYNFASQPAFRRRAHAIVLSHKGYRRQQISDILGTTPDTVSQWFGAWETVGLCGLKSKGRPGRPTIYDADDRERLKALVKDMPHQLKSVQTQLEQETGKSSSTETLKRALKK
jgi:transposase